MATMDIDDDIPPLEDMTEALQRSLQLKDKIERIGESKSSNTYLEIEDNADESRKIKSVQSLLQIDCNICRSSEKISPDKSPIQAETYCGFQKGFLFNKLKTKSNANEKDNFQENDTDTIDVIESRERSNNKNVIPEVQEAMKSQLPVLESNAWVTEDLLAKIMKNEKLSEKFLHPNFNEVISLLQKDPQQAMELCKSDPEMADFIHEFCALMGDHFTSLADTDDQHGEEARAKKVQENIVKPASVEVHQKASQTDDIDKKVKDILSNPKLVEILQDTEVQKLFMLLRSDPSKTERYMKKASMELQTKIQILIDTGLLQIQ